MKKKDKNPDVVVLVDSFLSQAITQGATDIHFEPSADKIVVKYRLDGVLNVVEQLPGFLAENLIARLKVLGGLLTYRNDIPQEGRITGRWEDIANPAQGHVLDQRLSVFPTIHGQRAVIRLFYENAELIHLEQLGFSDYILNAVKKIALSPQGVLLLTGPAGSGKSTTLGAVLRYILKNTEGKSIVALEDPVERNIDGVTQVQIPPKGEMTFPLALRSLLRQDPEVLMVGEIRDAETARIVIQAGLTGHLLMSTMHSGSPAGALLRLLEMGVEPYQVTSSISAVVNQRLVRRLCSECKKQLSNGSFQAVGCEKCFSTGFSGRALIAEIVQLNGQLRKAILNKADLEQLENLLAERGHMNMTQDARRLINAGITTQQEIDKVCGAE